MKEISKKVCIIMFQISYISISFLISQVFYMLYLPKINTFVLMIFQNQSLLIEYQGFGYYLDLFYYRTLEKVREFAIPSELIEFDYLIQVDEIIKFIEVENILEDEIFKSFTETFIVRTKPYSCKKNK